MTDVYWGEVKDKPAVALTTDIPTNSNLPYCKTIPSESGQERLHKFGARQKNAGGDSKNPCVAGLLRV